MDLSKLCEQGFIHNIAFEVKNIEAKANVVVEGKTGKIKHGMQVIVMTSFRGTKKMSEWRDELR